MSLTCLPFICIAMYLEALEKGQVRRPEVPRRCRDASCRAKKCYWRHGSYMRWLEEGLLRCQIRIERFKCKKCRKTISIAPVLFVPRWRYSLSAVAEKSRNYATTETSYRCEAFGPAAEPCSSASQIWRWVNVLSELARGLLLDMQAECVRCGCEEETMIGADEACCPNAWKAYTFEKAQRLHLLAKLLGFGRLVQKENEASAISELVGAFSPKKIEGLLQNIASAMGQYRAPHNAKPLTL